MQIPILYTASIYNLCFAENNYAVVLQNKLLFTFPVRQDFMTVGIQSVYFSGAEDASSSATYFSSYAVFCNIMTAALSHFLLLVHVGELNTLKEKCTNTKGSFLKRYLHIFINLRFYLNVGIQQALLCCYIWGHY